MDAPRQDVPARRRSAQRIRLVRHSAVARALDNLPEQNPPIRRVAGQRASGRRPAGSVEWQWREREPAAGPVSAERFLDPDDVRPLYAADKAARPRAATMRRVVVAACLVGLLALAGAVYVLVGRSGRHSAAPPPSPPVRTSTPAATLAPVPISAAAARRLAEAWIRGNVPRATALRADSVVAADLISAGYRTAGPSVSIDTAGAFLVTTPDDRDHARQDLARAADRVSSVPVAAFGGGAQRVEVAVLVESSASSLRARLTQQAAERLTADRALLANPRLTVAGTDRPWLTAGRLDMRAATALALLAAQTDVRVVRIALDPAEAAAQRPARTLAVSMTDPAALSDVLRGLTSPYAPTRVSATHGGWQLTWPVGLAPEGL
jgi:hypothetical protein